MVETSGRDQGLPWPTGPRTRGDPSAEVRLGVGVEFILSEDAQLLAGYQRLLWGREVSAEDAFVVTLVPLLF